MLYHTIYDAFGPAGLLGLTITFGCLLYGILGSASYYVFFVRWRRRFVPAYHCDQAQFRNSIRLTALNVLGSSLLILPVQLLIVFGNTRVYFGIKPYGWPYLIFSLFAVIVVSDTLIYWIHRALHTKWLARSLHIHHHRFRETTPLVAAAQNPLDSFAQSIPYHLYAMFVPINFWLYLGFLGFVVLWSVMIHDRIRWVPGKIINHAGCHTAHHWYNNYNFGQYFTVWDRLCGTYRDPDDLPDKFIEAKVPVYKMARRDIAAAE